jgi:hypothetical protein
MFSATLSTSVRPLPPTTANRVAYVCRARSIPNGTGLHQRNLFIYFK